MGACGLGTPSVMSQGGQSAPHSVCGDEQAEGNPGRMIVYRACNVISGEGTCVGQAGKSMDGISVSGVIGDGLISLRSAV